MKKDKFLALVVGSLLSLLCLSIFITQAFSFPLFAPIVITFDSSTEVQSSTATILGLYPTAVVIQYDDIGSLLNFLTLERSYSQIILIGHGSNQGILSSNQGIIPWEKIAQWVNALPSTDVYFISCDSYEVTQLVNKPSLGFHGAVDGPLAAYTVAVKDNLNHHVNINTNDAFSKLFERIFALNQGEKAQTMSVTCFTSSKISSTQMISTSCGSPPPPPPPPSSVSSWLTPFLGTSANCVGGSTSIIYVYQCIGLDEMLMDFGLILNALVFMFFPSVFALNNGLGNTLAEDLLSIAQDATGASLFVTLVYGVKAMYVGLTTGNWGSFILAAGGIVTALITVIHYWYNSLGWLQQLEFLAPIAFDIGTDSVAPEALIAFVVAGAFLFTYAAYELIFRDWSDTDDIPLN